MSRSRDEEDPHDHWGKNRSCTNCCFLFVFLAFLAGWATLSFFAFKYGDPEQVFMPTDSSGGICGRGINKDHPNLFYFNILKCAKVESITSGCNTEMVCLSQCPNYTASYQQYKDKKAFEALPLARRIAIKNSLICKYDIDIKNIDVSEVPSLLNQRNCASLYLKSEPRLGRCIPSELRKKGDRFLDDNNKTLNMDTDKGAKFLDPLTPRLVKDTSKAIAFTFNAQALFDMILSDLLHIKYLIIGGLVVGMIISFTYILLMQLIAGFMVWTSMVVLIILSGYFTYFSYGKYVMYKALNTTQIEELEDNDLDGIVDIDFLEVVKVQFNSILTNKNVWLALIIVSSIVCFILFITFVALRQRVRIAISLIKEASKAIMEAKLTLFMPLFPYLFHLLLVAFALLVALMLVATHKSVYRFANGPKKWQYCDIREMGNKENVAYNCTKIQLLDDKYVYYVHIYNIFGFLWTWFFISGMCQLVFAGVFSRYYWTFNKKRLPHFMILTSTYTAFRYHVGSVALGSFFIATVKLIQIIIEYIDKKCKEYGDNPVARGIIWCFRCCFWLLENFLRYINTNAYIMIAVHGKGYFESAKDAFNLILTNVLRVVVIDKVADYLLFFGKLSVSALMAFGTYYFVENYSLITLKEYPALNYPYAVPIVTIGLGTYLISSSFFAVYEMAVNTIFLCFLKDCQENDGSAQKPYYLSQGMMRILRYQNKTVTRESSEEMTGHPRSSNGKSKSKSKSKSKTAEEEF